MHILFKQVYINTIYRTYNSNCCRSSFKIIRKNIFQKVNNIRYIINKLNKSREKLIELSCTHIKTNKFDEVVKLY